MEQRKLDLIRYRIEKSRETANEAELALSHQMYKRFGGLTRRS